MRKLASIQVISELAPILGADMIERAQVLGWYLVVPKDHYQVGDRVVYCEVDSLLPEQQEFEFLRKGYFRPAFVGLDGTVLQRAGYRIRTVRLRGQVSQGICFPLSILPSSLSLTVGQDVTEVLGIIKHDPPLPACLNGKAIGHVPHFIQKTDETRVQTLAHVVARYQGVSFRSTEKVDGSSCTIFAYEGETGICGRTLRFDPSDTSNTIVRLAREMALPDKLLEMSRESGTGWAVQGEVLGPGIQGNRYNLKEHTILAFNVLEIVNNISALVPTSEFFRRCNLLGISMVPFFDEFCLTQGLNDLVEMSRGPSVLNPNVPREGIVVRPVKPTQDPEIGRLTFKVINPDFLLKYGE